MKAKRGFMVKKAIFLLSLLSLKDQITDLPATSIHLSEILCFEHIGKGWLQHGETAGFTTNNTQLCPLIEGKIQDWLPVCDH